MTVPRRWRGSSLAEAAPGSRLGRSWILALGLVPFDYDDLGITRVGDGFFREESTMASASRWQHERWVKADAAAEGTCTVRDRIEFVPRRGVHRVPGGVRIHRAIITALFRHRHRRLAAWSATGRARSSVGPGRAGPGRAGSGRAGAARWSVRPDPVSP